MSEKFNPSMSPEDFISQAQAEKEIQDQKDWYASQFDDAVGQEILDGTADSNVVQDRIESISDYQSHLKSMQEREDSYDPTNANIESGREDYFDRALANNPELRRADMLAQSVAEKRVNGGSEEDIKAIEDKIENILGTYAESEGADPTVIDRIMDATVREVATPEVEKTPKTKQEIIAEAHKNVQAEFEKNSDDKSSDEKTTEGSEESESTPMTPAQVVEKASERASAEQAVADAQPGEQSPEQGAEDNKDSEPSQNEQPNESSEQNRPAEDRTEPRPEVEPAKTVDDRAVDRVASAPVTRPQRQVVTKKGLFGFTRTKKFFGKIRDFFKKGDDQPKQSAKAAPKWAQKMSNAAERYASPGEGNDKGNEVERKSNPTDDMTPEQRKEFKDRLDRIANGELPEDVFNEK